jgi:hypothetical protein
VIRTRAAIRRAGGKPDERRAVASSTASFTTPIACRSPATACGKQRVPKTGIAIVAAMSLAFAAIHLPQFGTAGALFILFWGAMVTAIRLWTDSLTPGLLVHFFNNAAAYILIPLLMSARPRHSPRPGVQSHGFRLDRYPAGLDLMSDIPSDKPMSNLETCPRCGAQDSIRIPMGATDNPRPLTVLLAHWSRFSSIGLRARPSLCSFRSSMLAVATVGARVGYQRRH